MDKQEVMEKCFNTIMELKGVDEFKKTVKRLHIFLKNRETYSNIDITLPNYLWEVKRGGGVTTLVKAFAEYLYAAKAIEFCGTEKSFEFKLDYIAPDAFFSELTRLDKTIADFAGYNRFFKGVMCINIEEWLEHTSEDHFTKFLNYIAGNNDKFLTIFCICSDSKNSIESIEPALLSHLRLESLVLRFPDMDELVDLVESRYIQEQNLFLTECARTLLHETIGELAEGKHFNGFKSILKLTNDILYNILTNDFDGNHQISAEMLLGYSKDSNYVKKAKAQIGSKQIIGFAQRSM
jgi:hypothetical protein